MFASDFMPLISLLLACLTWTCAQHQAALSFHCRVLYQPKFAALAYVVLASSGQSHMYEIRSRGAAILPFVKCGVVKRLACFQACRGKAKDVRKWSAKTAWRSCKDIQVWSCIVKMYCPSVGCSMAEDANNRYVQSYLMIVSVVEHLQKMMENHQSLVAMYIRVWVEKINWILPFIFISFSFVFYTLKLVSKGKLNEACGGRDCPFNWKFFYLRIRFHFGLVTLPIWSHGPQVRHRSRWKRISKDFGMLVQGAL